MIKSNILDTTSLRFTRYLCGHFSNKIQASNDPTSFAHINIYFRPLNWNVFEGPGFYSEQSYDHDPWRPYRQGIHRLVSSQNVHTVENYGYAQLIRVAGSGFMPELLNTITKDRLSRRCGCSMVFEEDEHGCYNGSIEPGNKCIIKRDGKFTYLVSEVFLSGQQWISRDRGFDQYTNDIAWGSEHGPLVFERKASFESSLSKIWSLREDIF